jgi:hypothetical protein
MCEGKELQQRESMLQVTGIRPLLDYLIVFFFPKIFG